MLHTPQESLASTFRAYKSGAPEPLNRQFTERATRTDAIQRQSERHQLSTTLFPSGIYIYFIFGNWGRSRSSPCHSLLDPFCMKLNFCFPFALLLSAEEQGQLKRTLVEKENEAASRKKARRSPRCAKCGESKRGHPRNYCPSLVQSEIESEEDI